MLSRRRYPCVKAMDANSCGPAALATVVRHYGGCISQARLRELAGTDLQGTTLNELGEAAKAIGLDATCGTTSLEKLISAPLPAIVHFRSSFEGHFVVVFEISHRRVIIADPSVGVRAMPTSEFREAWSGNLMLLECAASLINEPETPRLYTLIRHLVEQKWMIGGALVVAICNIALGLALSMSLQFLIDKVISFHDYKIFELVGMALIGVTIFKGIFTALNAYVLPTITRRINNRERHQYIVDLLRKTQSFFDRHRLGDMFARIFDINKLSIAVTSAFISIWTSVLLAIVSVALLTRFSSLLGVACVGFLILYLTTLYLSLTRLRDPELQISHLISQLAGTFVEHVGNMRVVKSYTAEQAFREKITATYSELQNEIFRKAQRLGVTNGAMSLINGLTSAFILIASTGIVLKGHMTVGNVVFIYSAVGFFLASLESLGPSLASIQDGLIAVERLREFEPLKNEEACTMQLDDKPIGVSVNFQQLTFGYRAGSNVLKNITLHVPAGACVAVLGETGCGKSTLGYLLAGLYRPNEGQLFLDGVDAAHLDSESIRRRVAIVFQESGILASSIKDNITLGLDSTEWTLSDLRRASHDAHAHQFIEKLPRQYDHEIGSKGTSLSSGQRQRVALARALIRSPRLLILDEATSNLDVATEQRILDSLELNTRKRTTVIITHRLSTASLADTVIILDDGEIAEIGSPAALSQTPSRYSEMWQTQRERGHGLTVEGNGYTEQLEVG